MPVLFDFINGVNWGEAHPAPYWQCEAIRVVPERWPMRLLRRLRILPPRTCFPVTITYIRCGVVTEDDS